MKLLPANGTKSAGINKLQLYHWMTGKPKRGYRLNSPRTKRCTHLPWKQQSTQNPPSLSFAVALFYNWPEDSICGVTICTCCWGRPVTEAAGIGVCCCRPDVLGWSGNKGTEQNRTLVNNPDVQHWTDFNLTCWVDLVFQEQKKTLLHTTLMLQADTDVTHNTCAQLFTSTSIQTKRTGYLTDTPVTTGRNNRQDTGMNGKTLFCCGLGWRQTGTDKKQNKKQKREREKHYHPTYPKSSNDTQQAG